MLLIDRRAERTLTAIHWDAGGWRKERQPPTPEDDAYARRAGYLFDPRSFDHDTSVGEVVALTHAVSLADAADSFVASLSTRHRFLRPALAAYVVARSLPEPGLVPTDRGCPCALCGERASTVNDMTVLSFERMRWGGVRYTQLPFVWFCLDRLVAEGPAAPTPADVELLGEMLDALRALPPGLSLTDAEIALRGLRSNRDERLTLLEILSTIGVLEDPDHVGFRLRFVPRSERALPSRRFVERGYPGSWWSSSAGVDEGAVRELFPQLG